ncbi:OpgC domain-containing protein, partial [Mesorhizobium sp.]
LVGAALAYVAGALVWVHSPLWGHLSWLNLPVVLTGFDKTFLSLPRLLHILAVSYLIVVFPSVSNLFRTSRDHPLAI